MGEAFIIPNNCPVCSFPLTIEGDFLFCKNHICPARLSGSINIWIRNLGLLHWGETLVDNIIKYTDVQSIADLYRLELDDIIDCCSGPKVAKKCYDILHENKELTLELIIASLNIQNLGLATATDIVRAGYDSIDKVINLTFDDLIKIPNIGEITAKQILDGILLRKETLLELEKVLTIKKPAATGSLVGKLFCITGELSKPRKAIEKMIIDAGGSAKSSVTKDTSYLITNDPTTGSSKLKNAKKYNIPVIDEAAFYQLLI